MAQQNYYQPQHSPTPPRRRHTGRNITLIVLGVLVLIVVVSTALGSGSTPSSGTHRQSASAAPPTATDPNGLVCQVNQIDSKGYCPGDDPTPAPKPSPVPPPKPKVYLPVTDSQWQIIQEDPDSYAGETFVVYGTVTQHDSNTGTDEFRADAGPADNPNTNTVFDASDGSHPQVAALQVGQSFSAQVSVEGSLSYTTVSGGQTTVPELAVVSITLN